MGSRRKRKTKEFSEYQSMSTSIKIKHIITVVRIPGRTFLFLVRKRKEIVKVTLIGSFNDCLFREIFLPRNYCIFFHALLEKMHCNWCESPFLHKVVCNVFWAGKFDRDLLTMWKNQAWQLVRQVAHQHHWLLTLRWQIFFMES